MAVRSVSTGSVVRRPTVAPEKIVGVMGAGETAGVVWQGGSVRRESALARRIAPACPAEVMGALVLAGTARWGRPVRWEVA